MLLLLLCALVFFNISEKDNIFLWLMSKIREWMKLIGIRVERDERKRRNIIKGGRGARKPWCLSNSHNHNKKLSQLNDFCSIRNNQFFFTEPRQTWINRKRINRDLDSLQALVCWKKNSAFSVLLGEQKFIDFHC